MVLWSSLLSAGEAGSSSSSPESSVEGKRGAVVITDQHGMSGLPGRAQEGGAGRAAQKRRVPQSVPVLAPDQGEVSTSFPWVGTSPPEPA